ncbi:MAG: hypothetical protein KY391_03025 [Actinobacteria bacterium]|nr:hypothetical protein [Actinomycetota bacterium]
MGTFTRDGNENRMRWDRRTSGFMEVWYATAIHRATGCGVWFRYTLTAPTHAPAFCELWGFVFDPDRKRNFAGKQRFGIDRLGAPNGRDEGALVRIGDAWLSETHLEGAVARGERMLEWSLDLDPADRCFHHLPARIRRRGERAVSAVCSPNLSVPFRGSVTIDGETLAFDDEPGCQSHRWGKRHPFTWAWAHCSDFAEGDAVFEGVAAKAPLGPLRPTTTFLYLRYKADDLEFNELRWALLAKSRYTLPTWAFTARTDRWKIVGAARASIDDFVQITYVDPDGTPRYCANSEIGDLAVEVYRRSGNGWVHDGSLTSRGTAHLEFGATERFEELPVAF